MAAGAGEQEQVPLQEVASDRIMREWRVGLRSAVGIMCDVCFYFYCFETRKDVKLDSDVNLRMHERERMNDWVVYGAGETDLEEKRERLFAFSTCGLFSEIGPILREIRWKHDIAPDFGAIAIDLARGGGGILSWNAEVDISARGHVGSLIGFYRAL